jgi:hypothetical protein
MFFLSPARLLYFSTALFFAEAKNRSDGTPVELFLRSCSKNTVFAKTADAPSERPPL